MLMALNGVNRIYGYSCDMSDYSDENRLNIINSLVQKNIVCVDGEHFECKNEYKKIVKTIKNAEKIIVFEPENITDAGCICYEDDDLLVTTLSEAGRNHINMKWIKKFDFGEYIKDINKNISEFIKLKVIDIPSFHENTFEYDITGEQDYHEFIAHVL